jgi:short-subunit dehydrogenase
VKAATGLADSEVFILPLDVSDINSIEAAGQKANAHFVHIDVLVNNAGISLWSKLKDTSVEVIKKILDVNFLGGAALTKAVLPEMLNRKSGNIVVVSSILGKMVTPKQGAYNASKHALMGFYETLRAETQHDGINVLLVCPGFVRTNVAKNSLDRNGKPINKDNSMIANGLDPLYVSDKILQAIEARKCEIVIAGAKEKFGLALKRFFPGLFAKFVSGNQLV